MGKIVLEKISVEEKDEIFKIIYEKDRSSVYNGNEIDIISGNLISTIYRKDTKEVEVISNYYNNVELLKILQSFVEKQIRDGRLKI
jgi:hypothetical protein